MDFVAKMQEVSRSRNAARSVIFGMHNGPKGFDLWLNTTADLMAKSTISRMQFNSMPFQGLINEPHDVVDTIIELLDRASLWQYEIKIQDKNIQVIDPVCSHIIEEHEFSEGLLNVLSLKYGYRNGS